MAPLAPCLARSLCFLAAAGLTPGLCLGALPPGPGPFGNEVLAQPVAGARTFGAGAKMCDVSKAPYLARNGSNATAALRQAIADCGDLPGGGVVLVPAPLTVWTASLFMRSNLTLRVQAGATLLSTATGSMVTPETLDDAPVVWARRNALMTDAHAGFINGGRCLKKAAAQTAAHPDGCMQWSKLENVVIDGGGMLDADASDWYLKWAVRPGHGPVDYNMRPMMLDMMWVDGLTIRDIAVRRPGYWTIHPTFSNNVVVVNNSIITTGSNTDGCDPDSSWNVYIAENTFSTGDDCIAIKAGRDWSGRMVNISTQNVLAERNYFLKGHGVSIGSETSGMVRNITIRDSVLDGTNLAVRLKTSRGRGGGIEDVLYSNLSGSTSAGIQINTHYGTSPPTNVSATPVVRRITIRDVSVHAGSFMNCVGALSRTVALDTSSPCVLPPKWCPGLASRGTQGCPMRRSPASCSTTSASQRARGSTPARAARSAPSRPSTRRLAGRPTRARRSRRRRPPRSRRARCSASSAASTSATASRVPKGRCCRCSSPRPTTRQRSRSAPPPAAWRTGRWLASRAATTATAAHSQTSAVPTRSVEASWPTSAKRRHAAAPAEARRSVAARGFCSRTRSPASKRLLMTSCRTL